MGKVVDESRLTNHHQGLNLMLKNIAVQLLCQKVLANLIGRVILPSMNAKKLVDKFSAHLRNTIPGDDDQGDLSINLIIQEIIDLFAEEVDGSKEAANYIVKWLLNDLLSTLKSDKKSRLNVNALPPHRSAAKKPR